MSPIKTHRFKIRRKRSVGADNKISGSEIVWESDFSFISGAVRPENNESNFPEIQQEKVQTG